MRELAVLAFILAGTPLWARDANCPAKMTPRVESRLLPVLDALAAAAKKSDFFDKTYTRAFGALLAARDAASREARVALMDYYVGEGNGEELVCAVALDGSRRLLELYSVCDIQPMRSPVPRDRFLPLRGYALNMIRKGHVVEQCTFE
jgi:hypothetical protein